MPDGRSALRLECNSWGLSRAGSESISVPSVGIGNGTETWSRFGVVSPGNVCMYVVFGCCSWW